jgi:hypothetical protein
LANAPDAPLPNANLRAALYFIARTRVACPHCGAATMLTALALGPGHEIRADDTDADDTGADETSTWQPVEANALCFHVAAVSPVVYRRLRSDAPNFRFGCGETTGTAYWANHCQHCSALIGDDELHGEPGSHGFVLCSEAHAARVVLIEVHEPFEAAAGGYALAPGFFDCMQRT